MCHVFAYIHNHLKTKFIDQNAFYLEISFTLWSQIPSRHGSEMNVIYTISKRDQQPFQKCEKRFEDLITYPCVNYYNLRTRFSTYNWIGGSVKVVISLSMSKTVYHKISLKKELKCEQARRQDLGLGGKLFRAKHEKNFEFCRPRN